MSLKSERELNPTSRNQYSRAKDAALSKNYDYAINLLQAALKDEPLFLEGRRYLRGVEILKYNALSAFNKQMVSMKIASAAMKLSGAGKKEPAEQLVLAEEVLALDPFHLKANTLVGAAGAALGYPAFKAFAYETLAKGKPDDKPDKAILNRLAETYMELRETDKAEKTYQRILEFDPRDGEALSGLKNASAAHASRTGGWETQGSDYRNALKSKSESEAIEQSSKIVKSTEAIDEQIAVNFAKHQADPASGVHSKAIAQLFVQKNDYASAIPFYEHAFEVGNRVDSALEKIIGDLKLKRADQELMALNAAHAEQTDPETQQQYLAAIEQKKTEINHVRLEQAEARVRAHPNDGQFHFELGEALYKVGEYKRALTELQQGLKQPSVRYQALNLMGQCFMQQGMLDLAIKRFSDAQSELPVMDDLKKEITYNLGLAYEAVQKPDQALEQFKKIYEIDMGYRDVASRVEASYG
jgi:tetratricopeptide (TPR) repeat protein